MLGTNIPQLPLSEDRDPRAYLESAMKLRAWPDRGAVIRMLQERTEREPDNAFARLLLIQAWGWSNDLDAAWIQLNGMLGGRGVEVLNELEKGILEHFEGSSKRITSEYVCYPASMLQNLGFIVHRIDSTEGTWNVITKVMHHVHCGQEVAFYELVRPKAKDLTTVSPDLIQIMRPEDTELVLLSLERVPGDIADPSRMNAKDIGHFFDLYRAISDQALEGLPLRPGQNTTENGFSHGYLASAMHGFHTLEGVRSTIAWATSAVLNHAYDRTVVEAVTSISNLLDQKAIHTLVEPTDHYGLLHGDMHRHNVLMAPERTTLIDWSRCTIGPKGIDLAVLFRRFGHDRVIELAMKHGIVPANDQVSVALFSWSLVLVSLQLDLDGIKQESPEHLFLPAARSIHRALA